MDAATSCPPLVLIEWLDSGQPVPGGQWLEQIEPRRPHLCVSVGFLMQDEPLRCSPNLGASNGASDWDQASGVITIPASAVQRILPVSPHPDTARNGVGAATASHPRPLPNLYKTPQSRCSLRKRLPIRVADGRHIGHERPASGAKR
jgi:hypothetical protein